MCDLSHLMRACCCRQVVDKIIHELGYEKVRNAKARGFNKMPFRKTGQGTG